MLQQNATWWSSVTICHNCSCSIPRQHRRQGEYLTLPPLPSNQPPFTLAITLSTHQKYYAISALALTRNSIDIKSFCIGNIVVDYHILCKTARTSHTLLHRTLVRPHGHLRRTLCASHRANILQNANASTLFNQHQTTCKLVLYKCSATATSCSV